MRVIVRRSVLAWIVGLFLVGIFTSPSQARIIYVDNKSGEDRCDGSSLMLEPNDVGPVRTLQKAMRLAKPGDRIIVIPTGDPLREEVLVDGRRQLGGDASYPIVVEGNGVELLGAVPMDNLAARPLGGGVYRLESVHGSTHGKDWLFVDGRRAPTGGKELEPGHAAVVDGWFEFRIDPKKTIWDYAFAESRLKCGISIVRSNYWTIRNLTIRGYRLDGAQVHGPVEGVRFEHCRFIDNGRAGVAVYTNAGVAIVDSVAEGNACAGFVGRNLTHASLERFRITGSPKASDADPGTQLAIVEGEPAANPEPLVGLPDRATPSAATKSSEPPRARKRSSSDDE
jgi:hypothetical protein